MRRIAAVGAFAVVLSGAAALPAAASIDAKIRLPLSAIADVLVDDVHGRVFVAGSSRIAVRTLAGAAVTTITGQTGVTSLALSPDGSTLWAALGEARAVSAIDTTSLTETARYSLADGRCPFTIAAGATAVWFGYGCTSNDDYGVIDLSGDVPTVEYARTAGSVSPGALAISPTDPTLLVTGSGASLVTLRATGTTLAKETAVALPAQAGTFAVSPDGSRVVEAGGGVYTLPGLTSAGAVPAGRSGTSALAIAESGFVAVGARGDYQPDDLRIFTPALTEARRYDFGATAVDWNGLAFSSSGTLYVARTEGVAAYLHVLHDPHKRPSSVSLTAPSSVRLGTSFTVTGKVTAAAPIATGTLVHVYRTSATYGTKHLADVRTGTGGAFTFRDSVHRRGVFTYTAHWDGDATRGGAGRSVPVTIEGLTPPLTLTRSASTVAYNGLATVTAHLGRTFSNRVVTITMKHPDQDVPTTLKKAAVDANGNLRVTVRIPERKLFKASFAGDEVYAPHSVWTQVWPRVVLATALRGYYGTASNGYRLYRRSADPVIDMAIRPANNGCASVIAQRYSSGAWRTITSELCITIYHGYGAAVLTGTPVVGAPYRISATFLGDRYYAKTPGPWHYLRFT
ncbi:MAG TPA: hypothetical protein VNA20_03825 [Frankiaceae bacterium]|nr:hypothetical protein [Frankiaceae bacterium]